MHTQMRIWSQVFSPWEEHNPWFKGVSFFILMCCIRLAHSNKFHPHSQSSSNVNWCHCSCFHDLSLSYPKHRIATALQNQLEEVIWFLSKEGFIEITEPLIPEELIQWVIQGIVSYIDCCNIYWNIPFINFFQCENPSLRFPFWYHWFFTNLQWWRRAKGLPKLSCSNC